MSDPERTAIIDAGRGDLAVRYGELDRQAARIASGLAAVGLRPSDRVAICMENGLDYAVSWFGAAYAGCATLPIPPGSTAPEISFRLEHARCRLLLTDVARLEMAKDSISRTEGRVDLLCVKDVIDKASNELEPVDLEDGALAMLLYTSGTTGAPKCACITHESLCAHSAALADRVIHLGPEDRVLGTLPLTHSYGIRTTLLLPFHAGACTVFVPRYSPRRTLELCGTHHVTWLPAVPTMFIGWAGQTGIVRPESLRWCMSAGAPLPEDVRLRAEERLGAPVRQAYGLTEANLTTVNAPPDVAVPGSSGKPVFGVQVRIASEDGTEAPIGSRGEVLVRGPNVMAGYLDDPMATDHVMRGGWLHTGDIGLVDPEGRLTIVDRSKDLILRGGASVYPSEVENVLVQHGAVREAVVVGQPDDYYGEVVVAVVITDGSIDVSELDRWMRDRLAAYKVPIGYALVSEMPRSAHGKILKRRLAGQLASGAIAVEWLSTGSPTQ